MILEFKLPLISEHMTEALVECIFPAPGTPLKMGDKLMDVRVDLSPNFAQNCPPIAFYRVVVREKLILREFKVKVGESCQVGGLVALFCTESDEPIDQPAQRGIRVATAAIIYHTGMFSGKIDL